MLIVSLTQSTNVTLTLYEKSSNKVNPYFVFNVINKGTQYGITFSTPDISTAPWYWNEYVITPATSSIGLTNGVIPLLEGEYEYYIYEMSNQYDLNISNAVGLVEIGLMVVGLDISTTPPVSVNTPIVIPVSTLK